jgi:glycogen operon protein
MFQPSGRGAYASVNFVTAHDGYTLLDLVSYERKHNEANGEGNRDGHDDNISRNWGVEGPTDDPRVLDTRFRSMRSFIAALAFSQGVPMLSHGDEIARTQQGNNNAYAQDNELTWVHWDLDDRRRALLAFTRRCFSLRHMYAVLRRRHFFRGEPTFKDGPKDLSWIRSDGREMTDDDWHNGTTHELGMLISGDATDETDDHGRPITGDTLLLLFNASSAAVTFTLPTIACKAGKPWAKMIDTADPGTRVVTIGTGATTRVAPYSLVLLRHGDLHG